MKIFNILIAFAIISFSFISCDKIEAPYKEEIVKPVTEKKVLLEDFTGQKCVNCPAAHEIAYELQQAYGEENLITVSIHAGFFSTPSPTPPFDYDFRTEAGSEYNTFFGAQNYPTGAIDRVAEGGLFLVDKDGWGTKVAQQFQETAQIGIEITTNLQGNQVSGDIKIDFVNNIDFGASLQIWIIEDSIVKPQVAPGVEGGYIPDYVHNHVLRGAINGNWGQVLPASTYATDDSETISFSNYTLGSDWVADQLYIVAYVYNTETKQVIQVDKKKIVE